MGSPVHLVGTLSPSRKTLVASLFVMVLVQRNPELEGLVFNEEKVQRLDISHGLNKDIWMDGYPVVITQQSTLSTSPSWKIPYPPVLRNDGTFKIDLGRINTPETPTSLKLGFSTILTGNTWIEYRATQTAHGSIKAERLRVLEDYADKKEEAYTRRFAPVVEAPDYTTRTAGHVIFLRGDKATIVSDTEIQNWISKLGASLVPKDQQSFSSTDPAKIVFRFYVVRPFWAGHFLRYKYGFQNIDGTSCETGGEGDFGYANPKGRSFMKDIVFTQNGVVLVPENVLGSLSNESELAALLSYGISSTIQHQFFRLWSITTYAPGVNLHTMSNNDMKLCAFVTRLNEQALRLGIRRMYLSGYDIREAPYAWAVAQGKPVNNPVIDSKHPDKEIPWYAAYAFNYISQYYQDVDYSKLKRGRAEYQQFLQELRKADPEAFTNQQSSPKQARKAH